MLNRIRRQQVRDYWDECTDLYLEHMTTFQAGLFASSTSVDPFRDNALEIARRAGVRPGERLLDLGCGVCGPVVEIARQIPDVSFVCLSDCSRQVDVARRRIRSFGLEQRIEVVHLDFHSLGSLRERFDRCMFLESFGYTLVPRKLLRLVYDALRPGGVLYIKDVCHRWSLTPAEMDDLAVFNETYCYNTPSLTEVQRNVRLAGFGFGGSEIITSQMYRAHSRGSMFVDPESSQELTEFGRRHFKAFVNLPIDFYELKAVKPA